MLGKSVTRNMVAWNRVPGAMFDGHPGLISDGFKAYFNFGGLLWSETHRPPAEHETRTGLPDRDAADFILTTVIQCREQTPTLAGFECEFAIPARGDLKQPARLPP